MENRYTPAYTEPVPVEGKTTRNAYGEIVSFHGPVCAKCHQRITALDGRYPAQGSKPNICWHCPN